MKNKNYCRECGCTSESLSLVNVGFEDEGYACNDCICEYFRCSHCGRLFSHNHEWAFDSDFIVCNHCCEHYSICEDCSEIVPIENIFTLGEYDYCRNCYESRINDELNDILEDYSYKPEPIFLGECDDNLYIGVELEVDKGRSSDAARTITNKYYDVYLKHDGSLETGFEIVSHPATLNYHQSELGWDCIMEICTDNDMMSHDTTTCGLHCHVSRAFFGSCIDEQDLHIAKLILLINKFWDSHIVPFSRRNPYQLDRWATKPIIDIEENDTEADIVDKVKNTKYKGRYQGINLENSSTIEFRIFRGTLKLNTFIATLQFVDCISRYAKTIKLSDIYTTNWSDLFKERSYPELSLYLKEKNLI